MNTKILCEAGVNYEEGLRRFVGKAPLYEKYLGRFPQDPTFSELTAAMQEENYELAFRSAHTLKGIAGNLSFDAFMGEVEHLVEALRNQKDIPAAKQLFPPLAEKYQALVAAIRGAEGD